MERAAESTNQRIFESPFPRLVGAALDDGVDRFAAMPAAGAALFAWAAATHLNHTLVLITDGAETLETLHRDMRTLAPPGAPTPIYLPAWESLPGCERKPDLDISAARLDALLTLTTRPAGVVTTCIQALMQKTIPPAALLQQLFRFAVGEEVDLEDTTRRLTAGGYTFSHEVVEQGFASLRGGILDLWPPAETWPLRIECFGSQVESIRTFDPADQRSRGKREEVRVGPADEAAVLKNDTLTPGPVLNHLPGDTVFAWLDFDSVCDHAALYEELTAEASARDLTLAFEQLRAALARRPAARQLYTGVTAETASDPLGVRPLNSLVALPDVLFEPDVLESARRRLWHELSQHAAAGTTVALFFDTQGAQDHFRAQFAADAADGIALRHGALSEGFACEPARLVVVAQSDLYGRRKASPQRYLASPEPRGPGRTGGTRITDLSDMEPGDLVVHAEHGLGRYLGLNEITFNGQVQEVLTIEYDEGAKLHVPVSHAHLLSRYVGASDHRAPLHRLGGRRWDREKAAAERAIVDLAASLLEVQARRELLEGHAFAPDTPWQHDFEASFPYRETPDQERVIREVKADMESIRPMDRLICGDAGYGKTEVAMRAAFKTVMDTRQAAVLVPTTVLALQHYETFTERMAGYPVRIEMLSRFCTPSRRAHILRDLAEGRVDIVIGTHALVQPGVRFKNLGLVIVDEEQRFGVDHKERLKQLRLMVDVLTLTATPIPRTLYLSMTGARDMSLLQTPPRERMAIETLVTRNADKVVREAILRELNREGQVFYLHNRVMTIELARERLAALVPEARIAVAHGQMPAGELKSVMHRFVQGDFDVLLCTTIIESGMDIPRANTILIDRADRFGIADLYQLRGRVGRSNHKAYAYLLLPPHGRIDADASRRIGAVKKYSSLSAGFNLALRDLEIRGSGNILGAAQSGHITAIGFGLYCQLLRRTVARLKNEPLPPVVDVDMRLDFISLSAAAPDGESAAIPYSFIEDERLRITVYRKLAECAAPGDVDTLRAELADRFGPAPAPVARLLLLAHLRVVAAEHDISAIDVRENKARLTRHGELLTRHRLFPRLAGATPDDRLIELLKLVETTESWADT